MNGIVYLINHIASGKKYVGITTSTLKKRWQKHLSDAKLCKGRSRLHYSIRKYGEAAFSLSAIQECASWGNLQTAEIEWIDRLGSKSPDGFNLTHGGGGVCGFKMPRESVERGASKRRGRPVSDEQKKKQSAAMIGRKPSDETREKLKKARAGRIFSDETKKKIGDAHRGKKISDVHIAQIRAARIGYKMPEHAKTFLRRGVVANGVEYKSLSDAAMFLNVRPTTISRRIERGVEGYKTLSKPRLRAKRSMKQRQEMRERTSKRVMANGVEYASLTDAAEILNVTRPCVAYRIKHNFEGYSLMSSR